MYVAIFSTSKLCMPCIFRLRPDFRSSSVGILIAPQQRSQSPRCNLYVRESNISLTTVTNLSSFSMRTTRPSERHEQAAIYTAKERDEDKDGERPPSYSSKLLQKIAEFYSKSDSTGQQSKSPFVGRHIETLQRSAPSPLLYSILFHHIAIHLISAHHFTSHHILSYPISSPIISSLPIAIAVAVAVGSSQPELLLSYFTIFFSSSQKCFSNFAERPPSPVLTRNAISHYLTPHHITSHHLTSPYITSHHITSPYITSHHITSPYITSHGFT